VDVRWSGQRQDVRWSGQRQAVPPPGFHIGEPVEHSSHIRADVAAVRRRAPQLAVSTQPEIARRSIDELPLE
jgi:hypothetical protein